MPIQSKAITTFVIFFMVVVIWFALMGIYVSYEKVEYHNHIWIPFVLMFGFVIEGICVLIKKGRIGDGWAKTRVVSAK